MTRGAGLVALPCSACASSPPPPPKPPPPPPKVRIEVTATACVDAQTNARLEQVLAARHATYGDMVIRVDATPSTENTDVRLRITRASSGDVGLDRAYSLGPSDCASAADLLALGVERFLDAFPDWAGPPPPEKPIAPPPQRWTNVTIVGAANSMFAPFGIDGSAGGSIDFGAERHRVGGTFLVRASVPQAAGSGSFQQMAFLVGAAYRYRSGVWLVRAEARGGALLVSGIGLDENNSDWLPWWEGAAFAGRRFSWGTLGVEVAASGLTHKAVTSDGLVEEDIPLLRLGLGAEFGLWSGK